MEVYVHSEIEVPLQKKKELLCSGKSILYAAEIDNYPPSHVKHARRDCN